jgi:predicted phage-related endonuclease
MDMEVMKMKVLDLDQGSDKWLEARLNHFTASEAAAMMNESQFMSRDQLLDLKKGWKKNPDDSFKLKLFEDGHRFEAAARPIAEMDLMEDLPPLVGSIVIDGLLLLASFDGLLLEQIAWEHKGWNEVLSENVRNGILVPHYYWQLEQQLLISGAEFVKFTVSDGTRNKLVSMNYYPVEGRREQLIAGWKQFHIDLNDHQMEAKQEFIPAKVVDSSSVFPMIDYEVQEGSLVVSNAKTALTQINELAHAEMKRKLETDQDFSDKNAMVKATVIARADLKKLKSKVEGEFVSYAEFSSCLSEIDKVLQKMQSDGERKLKTEKDKKKQTIIDAAEKKFNIYIKDVNKKIAPVLLRSIPGLEYPDYDKACKNKRTLESIKSNVNAEVARVRIEIDSTVESIKSNLKLINEASIDYPVLFNDVQTLALKDTEAVQAMINLRIREHLEAEDIRLKKTEDDRVAAELAEADEKQRQEDEAATEKLRLEEEEAQRIADEKLQQEEAEKQQQELMSENIAVDPASGEDVSVTAEVTVTDGEITNIKEVDKEELHESAHIQGRMVRKNNFNPDKTLTSDPDPELESEPTKDDIEPNTAKSPVPVDLDNPYVRGYLDCLNDYSWEGYNNEMRVGTTLDSTLLPDAIDKFWIQFQEDQKQ